MATENTLAEAILRNQWDDARERIKNGEQLSGNFAENNRSQILNGILRAKAFDLIDNLTGSGYIATDVYEFENFDKSIFKNIAFSLAGDEDSTSFLKTFLPKISSKNDEVRDMTALGFCLEEGAAPAVIQTLIDEGFDPHYKNNAEMNLLHAVVNKGMLDPNKGVAYLELLLQNGVDVNQRNVEGTTPLMLAVQRNKKEFIDLLLQNGADPNERDNKGQSSFFFAVNYVRNKAIYDLLRQNTSPDFGSANREGENLLNNYLRMETGSSQEQIGLLLQMIEDGADIYQTSLWYGQPKSGADWLAEKAPDTLKALLSAGVIEINRQDDQGNTLLHKVCAYNVNYEQEVARRLYQKVKLLLEAGADPEIRNDKDETALMLASGDNLKIKTVELLMQQKAK